MHTKYLILAAVLLLSGVNADSALAGSRQLLVPEALPPDTLDAALRDLSLEPVTPALRRGPYYVLHALDPSGVERRVVADAELGDILSLTPIEPLYGFAPYYVRGPRIIQVPEDGNISAAPVEPTGDPTRDFFLAQIMHIPEDLPPEASRGDRLPASPPLPKAPPK